jgi:uncharacterized Tic20 family protein
MPPIDPPPNPGAPGTGPIPYATPSKGSSVYTGPAPDKDSVTMAMLCHLLGIFTSFIGPLVIWLIKKDSSPFVDDQGKEALNFQIIMLIATFACFLGLCLAPFLILAVQITRLILGIIGTVKCNSGVAYRYPLPFRLIK